VRRDRPGSSAASVGPRAGRFHDPELALIDIREGGENDSAARYGESQEI
jgi:hypothetical protein